MLKDFNRGPAVGRRPRCAALLFSALLATPLLWAAPPANELVLGQSLNTGANTDGTSRRIEGAVKSYLAQVNLAGGIKGQKLRVVTLNDEGDPKRHAENLRTLAREHGAVALLNCPDDASCAAAAAVTRELRIPMVGAMGGSPSLARKDAPWLFRIRPDYTAEAATLARHLKAIAVQRVAVVTDMPRGDLATALGAALGQSGVESHQLVVAQQPSSAQALLAALEKNQYHAAVLVLELETLEWLISEKVTESAAWPRVITATSSANQVAMLGTFKGRMFGFTAVVPNPEMRDKRVIRNFADDLTRNGAEYASTFNGVEGYISAVVAVEALKRAGKRSPDGVTEALRSMRDFDLGGFVVSFDRDTGSSWVDLGVRSRNGNLLR